METPREIQTDIIRSFNEAGDAFNQFTYLIQCASELKAMPEEKRTPQSLVNGCQSQVWLHLGHQNGKILMEADSDTLMVRGVLSILKQMFHLRSKVEIQETPVLFVKETALKDVFDSRRIAGIETIVARIKEYAASL